MIRVLVNALAAVCLLASAAIGESIMAARTIRSHTIVNMDDIVVTDQVFDGALTDPSEVVGLETRIVLYQGRPIKPSDIGPPAIIDRNQIVMLVFRHGTLMIAAEARSLGRAGVGDVLKVLNLNSKSTVTGIVAEDGTVRVGGV